MEIRKHYRDNAALRASFNALADTAGFEVEDYHEEDCTFFVKGGVFRDFEAKKLRIPSLSHA